MKGKILIVNSNSRWLNGREWMEPMTNIPILASILNGSFDYDIIDCNGEDMSEKQAEEKIAATNADIVLITTLSLDLHKQYSKMVEISKHALPNAITVMGGVYPTTCYEHAIEDKNLDFIFLGHAEERLNNFINALLNKEDISKFEGVCYYAEDGALILNPVTTYIGDVQTMVKPNYEKFNLLPYAEKGYHIAKEAVRELPVTTSYGCPHNCIFCATRTISGRKVAFRPIEDIIEEIAYFKEKYKVEAILFLDDNILTNKARARKLFQRMIEENFCLKFRLANAAAWLLDEEIIDLMSRAGCYALTVSIESGCDRVLHDIIRKPMKKEIIPNAIRMCQEKNFFVSANIVIGFPGETWDEIRETIAFGELCNPDYLQIHIATPLPKTDLYFLCKEIGAIPKDFDFFGDHTYQGYELGIIQTDEFTPRELEILRSYEWDRINFSTAKKRDKFCHYRGISAEELVAHRKRARLSVGQDDGMHNSKIYGKRLSDE